MIPSGQIFIKPRNIRIGNRLLSLEKPLIMGIINVTPDSFYDGGMYQTRELVKMKAGRMLEEGAAILDVGACSTRPGSIEPDEETEKERLSVALTVLRSEHPDSVISVDTYRSGIAEWAVKEHGVQMINDVSGGNQDPKMFETIGRLRVAYVLMHMLGSPRTMQDNPKYSDVVNEISLFFAARIRKLTESGVADIILDPGFGFGKTLDHNYDLLARLPEFRLFERPLLVGLSRKSMIYSVLKGAPESSLNGTTVVNTLALLKGAEFLRVHDVKQAHECIQLIDQIKL
ncbi:MAG: dihydropteroate synthase [Porphyromonadaceae bacterium]|nr:MAG: dihydropteroate synthase [Porphyromonadaceae bacterium]